MDARHFDALAKVLSVPDSRRRLLAILATLPVLGGLLGLLAPEDATAKERRRRRKQRHKRRKDPGKRKGKGKQTKKCKPESVAQTCAGTCGSVVNNCKQTVDCGSCACDPPCAACFTCQEQGANLPGACVMDPAQQGQGCGDPGQVCQADGTCACDATSCPECTTCGGDGTCAGCAACCDGSGVCQDGDTNAACGSSGTCDTCTGQEICQGQSCICIPECTGKCGGADDGCGGKCTGSCGAGAVCDDGLCAACNVECEDTPAACGTTLQNAINAAAANDTLWVCPGRYQGGFSITKALTVVGAGEGDNPATNTVLDGNDAQRVLHIPGSTGAVVLAGLHLTGGRNSDFGAGLYHEGTSLEARDCTVAGNQGVGVWGAGVANLGASMTLRRCTVRNNHALNGGPLHGDGGGLVSGQSILTLEDCLIRDNQADNTGGGLYVPAGTTFLTGTTEVRGNAAFRGGGFYINNGSVEIAETCRVTENEAVEGEGGGIKAVGGTVTLLGADPSPIVVNNCHENCVGTVPKCAETPVFCPA